MKSDEMLQLAMAEIKKKLDHIALLVEGKAKSDHESFHDYLSSTEAAEYLKVPIGTLYNLVHRRAIPYMKRGKRLYFDRQELKSVIEQGRRKTMSELESFAANHLSSLAKK